MRTKFLAEFFGTFALVFCGTGAVVFNAISVDAAHPAGAMTHIGIALVFGLVVLALIYTFGDVSGTHINPAVTLGFVAAGRFPFSSAIYYIVAQMLGAVAASAALAWMFPVGCEVGFGATIAKPGYEWQCFVLEAFLTWFLMLVVLHVSTGAKEKGITAGIAVGAVIALEAMFAGPICGASMNPARSFGPALVASILATYPTYLFAPILGALLAVPTFALTRPKADGDRHN
ncbi:MAG: aquaporin [Pirellulales bacterium]